MEPNKAKTNKTPHSWRPSRAIHPHGVAPRAGGPTPIPALHTYLTTLSGSLPCKDTLALGHFHHLLLLLQTRDHAHYMQPIRCGIQDFNTAPYATALQLPQNNLGGPCQTASNRFARGHPKSRAPRCQTI